MGKKTKETSVEQRKLVVKLVNSSKSMQEVANLVECSKGTVFNIITKEKQTGCVENRPRSGRLSKITPRNQLKSFAMLKKSRFYSAKAIQTRL